MNSRPSAIILAAGKGTRMKSDLPKVVHEVAGSPMVRWVARACAGAGCGRVILVVGHMQELVRRIFADWDQQKEGAAVEFVEQTEQHGTGHAAACAAPRLEREAAEPGNAVFVLAGDGPLVRASTIRSLGEHHRRTGAAATMATAVIDDPIGYGRITRDAQGRFSAIVEEKHLTAQQRGIREVNPSYYCFDAQALFSALPALKRNSVAGEYYLTDVPEMLLKRGMRVETMQGVRAEEVLSVNTPEQLAQVDRILRERDGAADRAIAGGRR